MQGMFGFYSDSTNYDNCLLSTRDFLKRGINQTSGACIIQVNRAVASSVTS